MSIPHFKGLRTDGRGLDICLNCWDGSHFKSDGFSNCLQNGCECPCVKLLLDKPVRFNARQRKEFQKEHQHQISTEGVLEFTKGRSEPEMVKAKL